MKNLTKFFLILVVGFLSSCSSDNNSDSDSYKADIIGTWEVTSILINGEEFIDSTDCLDTVTFTATTQHNTAYYDYEDGNGCVVDDVSTPEPYTIDGNKLSSSSEGDAFEFEITLLNETTLKLKATETEGGVSFTFIETLNRL